MGELRARWRELGRDNALMLGAGLLLLLVLFWAPLNWLWREWRTNAYYEHGPLVPVAALVAAGLALRTTRFSRGVVWGAVTLIVVGVVLRVVGAAGNSDFIGAVALLPALVGVLGLVLGAAALRALLFPVSYLIFMVPMPFIDELGFFFQRVSSWMTATILGRTGMPIEFWGAEISLPGQNFVVGIPCSGLYSIMTLTALGLLYAWLLQLPGHWRAIVLIVSLPIVAMFSNVCRLSSILVIAHLWGTEMAINYYHDFAGIVFWILSLAMMFLVGRTLEWRRTSVAG